MAGEILELVAGVLELLSTLARQRGRAQARRRLQAWSEAHGYQLIHEATPELRGLIADTARTFEHALARLGPAGTLLMVESTRRGAEPRVTVHWPCAGAPLDPTLVEKGWVDDDALSNGLLFGARLRVLPRALRLMVPEALTPELVDQIARRMERGQQQLFATTPFR